MKEAMRTRDRVRLDTIRMLRGAVRNAEIEARRELDDEDLTAVLARELKLRQESLEGYRRAGRREQAQTVEREIETVRAYLPEPASEDEIAALVRDAAAAVEAEGPQDMGRVMGRVMPRLRGRADGAVVSRIAREQLGRPQE